jgi:hypothetical protein
MSTAIVKRWRVYCTTESKYETVWSDTEPTTCPYDPINHTIDVSKTASIETISENMVKIQEELVATQGIYKFRGYNFTIPAGTPGDVTQYDVTWKRPVTLLNGEFDSETLHIGDKISAVVIPPTPIGAITATVNPGDTVIQASPTVFDHIYNGYNVYLTDGVNLNSLGECMSIDSIAGTITVETAAVNTFSPVTPSYIQIDVPVVENLNVKKSRTYEFARKKVGGKLFDSGVIFRIYYTNNSGSEKEFSFNFEYLY